MRNMKLLGHSDQAGRRDGVQFTVSRGHAYVGHMFSKGFSVTDVIDPTSPKAVNYIQAPSNTWNIHLQAHDDLLLVIHGKDMFADAQFADERSYYKGSGSFSTGAKLAERNWSAGMAVFDISRPSEPRQIGFMPVGGTGLHRIWYVGGRWAYASALLDGLSDYILITIDMGDPTAPKEVGRFWLPGMNLAAGETSNWPMPTGRFGLHHAIVHEDIAYCGWRDACLAVVNLKDRASRS
jgi:hypothetical protein